MNTKILRRARIEKELSMIFEYPLTILSATMGYGKTTSVRTFLDNKDCDTIWITLLGSDGDELLFWHKLSEAVGRIYPEIGKQLESIGFPMDARQIAQVVAMISKLKRKHPTAIVIDDYHLMDESKQLGALMEAITQEDISNVHLILVSRTRPLFNHINLFAKGLCNYLDTKFLAFTKQEIKDYLILMGYRASDKEIAMLLSYTNGWISAIYLLQLGLKQGIPITEVSYITQLVDKNLFSSFDESTKQALLRLSVLDCFTLQQASKILDYSNVLEMIEQLMEQNAFIEYDRRTGVYKLHNVLLDFLRERYLDEFDKQRICHIAGEWFLEEEDFVRAIEYYHRAGKIEELLGHMNWEKYMKSGYLGVKMMYVIFREMPTQWYIEYPLPLLHFALCFAISKDKNLVNGANQIVEVLEPYYETAAEISLHIRNRVLGEIEIVKIFLTVNNAEKMVELSIKTYEYLDGDVSYMVYRYDAFTFGVPHFLYSYYREAGKLKETLDCLSSGFPPKVFDGSGMGCDIVAQAEYALETGNFDQVDALVDKSIYKARTMEQVSIEICANFTRMRYYLVKGEIAKAKELLLTTRNYLIDPTKKVNSLTQVIYNSALDMCEGYIYGCLNQAALIPKWLATGNIGARELMMRGLAFPYVIYGKALMLQKNWTQLEILSDSFEEEFLVFHNQLGLLHHSIYQATAKYHLYGMKAGMDLMLVALKEARADGIVLPFAEHADFVMPMLYELKASNAIEASYLDKVIALCERYRKTIKQIPSEDITLTEREKQVLQYLSRGLTQREIANELYVSVSTAKKHMENIYRKLNVNNKISALQRAKEHNLI